ncbi:hypothetical protein [Microbacterium sp. MYb64]|uniref:hypothetical protein n=1 Tax=Microbacterium sp. MYb64 TaxID=1848691 RepID=UPI000CFD5806|nr:hypothetical protein [Microbacterium sp. MYb64]PRB08796.1 hypothetical protein CQ044_00025 [Microbacterium sp. MYb64]
MGTEFKAASGRTINIADDGSLLFGRANGYLSRETAFDAEEYFRAKRDEELGRWRWPINPQFVVYREEDGVFTVLKETTGLALMATREGVDEFDDTFAAAARAYFEAHPERKPWEDAKPWEVWVVTVNGSEWAVSLDEDREFRDRRDLDNSWMHITSPDITDARRIWPEDAA